MIIRNCVTFGNGFLPDGTNAGNGNGFKLGGSSIEGNHKLIKNIKPRGRQDTNKIYGKSNYYWDGARMSGMTTNEALKNI